MKQGSYLLIEPGMAVQGIDGDMGSVAQIVADEGVDIFRGIVVAHGLPLLTKYGLIAAEHVISVINGVVQVDLSRAAIESLPLLEKPSLPGT